MTRRASFVFVLLFVLALAGAAALFAWDRPAVPDRQATLSLAAANSLLEQGQAALAAETYDQLAEQGVADVVLFYNRGLAYIQMGDLERALRSLETAYAMAPRDAEVAAALEQARGQIAAAGGVPLLSTDRTGLDGMAARLTRPWLTLDELAMLAVSLWIGLALLLLALTIVRSGSKWSGLLRVAATALGVLLLAVILLLGARLAGDLGGPLAFLT